MKLNQYLDKIQDKLINELVVFEAEAQNQTTGVFILIRQEKQLNKYKTTMSAIKQFATDLPTLIFINGIQCDAAVIDNLIQSLLKTNAMNNATFSYQTDNIVQQFSTNVPTLGKITVQSNPCKIYISRTKNKQAQIMATVTPTRSIENIKLKLLQTIHTRVRIATGCVLLPDGRMLFSCYKQSRVRSINKDGTQDFDTGKMSPRTFDITYIGDRNTIAVTSGCYDFPSIRLIDMASGQIKKTFSVKTNCYGIAYRNNALMYCAENKGLCMIYLIDWSEEDILVRKMSWGACVATYKDKLYYINMNNHSVTCCDLYGNTKWQFKDIDILWRPFGITVDNYGNVYVVADLSSNLVVISSDGKNVRHLLGKEEGLDRPQSLHYGRSTNRLLVANASDIAFLFEVE